MDQGDTGVKAQARRRSPGAVLREALIVVAVTGVLGVLIGVLPHF